MSKVWPNKLRDMRIASEVMASYFEDARFAGLNLFELVVDKKEKSMGFRLSPWVNALAEKFEKLYGEEEGDRVMRRVVSLCMRENQTLH